MKPATTTLQWRAAFAAALLILIGCFLGVVADRLWLTQTSITAGEPEVSVEALANALDLSAQQREEIVALVDSIGWALSEAMEQSPDSVGVVAQRGRARLEQAVPADRLPRLRRWMDGRRSEMLEEMRGGGGGRGRGFMSDSPPGGWRRRIGRRGGGGAGGPPDDGRVP